MAKEDKNENKFTLMDGFQFGLGFFLANLVGFAVIGVIAWVIILIARMAGLAF